MSSEGNVSIITSEIVEKAEAAFHQAPWETCIEAALCAALPDLFEAARAEIQKAWQEAPNERTDSARTSYVRNSVGPGCSFSMDVLRRLAQEAGQPALAEPTKGES